MKRSHLISIGITVLCALALIVRGLLFLHPHPGDGGTKIHVRFQNIDKIAKGSKVTFAGKAVGEVEKILVIQDAFDERPKDGSIIYPYELILSIDSSVKIYSTDIITAKTAGLLGERFIAILPQAVKNEPLVPVTPQDIIFAFEPMSVEDTFKDLSSITKKAEKTFDSLSKCIETNEESIGHTIQNIETATKKVSTLLDSIDTSSIVPEFREVSKEIKVFFQGLNHPEGSFQRFIQDPKLYNETYGCIQKANTLFDSLASYGLFFPTNAAWQRAQTQEEKKRREEEEQNKQIQQKLINDLYLLIQDKSIQEKLKTDTAESALFVTELTKTIDQLKTIDQPK